MAATTAIRARKRRPRWVKRVKQVSVVLLMIGLVGFSAFAVYFMQELKSASAAMQDLPSLMARVVTEPSVIVSSDGKVLYQISSEYRKPISYTKIPKHVRDAVLAAEDKRFFDHEGVDYIALGRVLLTADLRDRRVKSGGSTLTMQLSKLLFTSTERSFRRKVKDMAIAVTMERELTKEQILELYMNKVYFGSGAHGIAAAADVYFNKKVDDLTIAEAAMLARCVRRPSDQNPFDNLEVAMDNRDIVLSIMREENMITQDEYDKAKAEKPKLNKQGKEKTAQWHRANYFVRHVLDTLHKDMPNVKLEEGGYRIETTLDSELQALAEKEVKRVVNKYKGYRVTTGAFVLIDKDGRVLAEVGGYDFQKNQFNVVTQGSRQPGSAFKPFVYATALATGAISPNEYISNSRYVYDPGDGQKPWTPKNSNGKYGGMVSLRTAFSFSYNIPAARTMEKVGPSTVSAYAKSVFGFTSEMRPVMAMSLGSEEVRPLEMAQAYSVFMNRGNRAKPYPIVRVLGPDGEVVKAYQPEITFNVLDPGVCDVIDDLMRAVITSGTGTRARDVPNARGKTGTTSENKDAWFCGYTDGLVGIGWVANERKIGRATKYEEMSSRAFGGTMTVEIWEGVMKRAHAKHAQKIERVPSDIRIQDAPVAPVEQDDEPTEVPIDPPTYDDGDDDGTTAVPPINNDPPVTEPPVTEPPVTEPPRQSDPPVRENREVERAVEVEVCADTGQRASIYCPETVVREFPRGRAPRGRCRRHGG